MRQGVRRENVGEGKAKERRVRKETEQAGDRKE